MEFKEVLEKRRAYRSFKETKITNELIEDLAVSAGLSPSCFNMQPWRFVFVKDKEYLEKLKTVFSKGNEWGISASLVVAVFSEIEKDCVLPDDREYYLFDTGMATAFLILRATDLGLVAHPIAGYNEVSAKEILKIPSSARLITLIFISEKSEKINPVLSEKQILSEKERPQRNKLDKYVYINSFENPYNL
jgi:nitroreductase